MRLFLQNILRFLSIIILKKYHPKIVAITGSVGKTTAKEAIFLVLNSAFPKKVRASERNLNTEIGVPLTVIGGKEAKRSVFLWLKNFVDALKLLIVRDVNYPEILVLEMAADKPGDIEYLTSFVYPDVAVITAIGEMPVHLEFFPEKDAYIGEKSKIIKNLKPGGAAILNYDDLSVRELRNIVPTERLRVYYGFEAGADVRIINFSERLPASSSEIDESGVDFKLEYNGESVESKLERTLGVPPLYAALAATAVGLKFGLKLGQIAAALSDFVPPKNRLELKEGVKETILIDDSYNSSPLAATAALELLAKFKKNRKIAVLGSMRELGINTEEAHRLVGRKAARVADVIFLIGDEMVFAREEAEKINMKPGQDLFWFDSAEEAAKKVEEVLQEGDVVLIKGSRAVGMEKIVREIEL